MHHFSKTLVLNALFGAIGILILSLPSVTFAAIIPSATSQQLSAELTQINTELMSGATGTATVTLSQGQSSIQATSTATGGVLKIALPTFEHTLSDPTLSGPQPVTYLAKIALQYMPCVAISPNVCEAMASSSYPVMTSDLANGQDTGYLHYLITLTNLSSTTATLQITDSSFLANLQNQVNAIAAQVTALVGK